MTNMCYSAGRWKRGESTLQVAQNTVRKAIDCLIWKGDKLKLSGCCTTYPVVNGDGTKAVRKRDVCLCAQKRLSGR